MNNNIKLVQDFYESSAIKASGLAPVIGYEPWAIRTIDSIKQSLYDGIPVLIRVHPAADYPCENENDAYKLDMESHSILIVGYDDESRQFDVVDPWDKLWGGQYGGVQKLSYDTIPITCVNSSYGKVSRFSLPQKKVIGKVDDNGNASVYLSVGYYMPRGYIIDQKLNKFTKMDLKVSYEVNGELREYHQEIHGEWPAGSNIETAIPLGKEFEYIMDIEFELNLTLQGKRPYPYQDTLEYCFEEKLNFMKQFDGIVETDSISYVQAIN